MCAALTSDLLRSLVCHTSPSKHRPLVSGHKPASKTFLKMQTNTIDDTRGTPTPEVRTTFFVTNRRASKRRPVKETNPSSAGGQGSVAGLGFPPKKISNKTHITNQLSTTLQPRALSEVKKKHCFFKRESVKGVLRPLLGVARVSPASLLLPPRLVLSTNTTTREATTYRNK